LETQVECYGESLATSLGYQLIDVAVSSQKLEKIEQKQQLKPNQFSTEKKSKQKQNKKKLVQRPKKRISKAA